MEICSGAARERADLAVELQGNNEAALKLRTDVRARVEDSFRQCLGEAESFSGCDARKDEGVSAAGEREGPFGPCDGD